MKTRQAVIVSLDRGVGRRSADRRLLAYHGVARRIVADCRDKPAVVAFRAVGDVQFVGQQGAVGAPRLIGLVGDHADARGQAGRIQILRHQLGDQLVPGFRRVHRIPEQVAVLRRQAAADARRDQDAGLGRIADAVGLGAVHDDMEGRIDIDLNDIGARMRRRLRLEIGVEGGVEDGRRIGGDGRGRRTPGEFRCRAKVRQVHDDDRLGAGRGQLAGLAAGIARRRGGNAGHYGGGIGRIGGGGRQALEDVVGADPDRRHVIGPEGPAMAKVIGDLQGRAGNGPVAVGGCVRTRPAPGEVDRAGRIRRRGVPALQAAGEVFGPDQGVRVALVVGRRGRLARRRIEIAVVAQAIAENDQSGIGRTPIGLGVGAGRRQQRQGRHHGSQ